MLQHAREIAPSVSWEILVHVKRTGGISVNELAGLLKMSYMGVKQHCDELKKRGYVDTWRRPKATGRPEKIFRPTPKLDLVLPNWGNDLCLGILSLLGQVHGENAPERLLYSFLQQKCDRWTAKIKGTTLKQRATEFTKARNTDGWMSEVLDDAPNGLRIVEHHSPLAEVARLYPNVWEMEAKVMERFFGGSISRVKSGNSMELILPVPEGETRVAPSPASVVPAASAPEPEAMAEAEPEFEPEPEPEPTFEPEAESDEMDAELEPEIVAELELEETEHEPERAPKPVATPVKELPAKLKEDLFDLFG